MWSCKLIFLEHLSVNLKSETFFLGIYIYLQLLVFLSIYFQPDSKNCLDFLLSVLYLLQSHFHPYPSKEIALIKEANAPLLLTIQQILSFLCLTSRQHLRKLSTPFFLKHFLSWVSMTMHSPDFLSTSLCSHSQPIF